MKPRLRGGGILRGRHDMAEQNKVEEDHINKLMGSLNYKWARVENSTVTACWSFLPNGFQLGYGETSSVDPENYNPDKGRKYSHERCEAQTRNKLWELEGYLLKITGHTSEHWTI